MRNTEWLITFMRFLFEWMKCPTVGSLGWLHSSVSTLKPRTYMFTMGNAYGVEVFSQYSGLKVKSMKRQVSYDFTHMQSLMNKIN